MGRREIFRCAERSSSRDCSCHGAARWRSLPRKTVSRRHCENASNSTITNYRHQQGRWIQRRLSSMRFRGSATPHSSHSPNSHSPTHQAGRYSTLSWPSCINCAINCADVSPPMPTPSRTTRWSALSPFALRPPPLLTCNTVFPSLSSAARM